MSVLRNIIHQDANFEYDEISIEFVTNANFDYLEQQSHVILINEKNPDSPVHVNYYVSVKDRKIREEELLSEIIK